MKRKTLWLGCTLVLLAVLAVGVLKLVESGLDPGRSQQDSTHREHTPPAQLPDDSQVTYKEPPATRRMSMVELLANPKQYDGAHVATLGYLTLEYEDEAIYLHREDCDNYLITNAIRLQLAAAQAKAFRKAFRHHCYAVVEGDFHAPEAKTYLPYGGSLGNIVLLEPWRSDPLSQTTGCD